MTDRFGLPRDVHVATMHDVDSSAPPRPSCAGEGVPSVELLTSRRLAPTAATDAACAPATTMLSTAADASTSCIPTLQLRMVTS